MELSEILIRALRARFPERGLQTGQRPEPVAVFPGLHPGIEAVSIYDDGGELTVSIDPLTHGHFGEYADGMSERERLERVVANVIEFLDALFADQVVVWGQWNVGGGWYFRSTGDQGLSPRGVPEYVWSGPVSP